LADRDPPLETRTHSHTHVRPEGCKSAKRARRMRNSAAEVSEDIEAVKSMIGEWSATNATVADRSASGSSSQNKVSVTQPVSNQMADVVATGSQDLEGDGRGIYETVFWGEGVVRCRSEGYTIAKRREFPQELEWRTCLPLQVNSNRYRTESNL
jgi:hypothetical protein